jgi:hypothetical protein
MVYRANIVTDDADAYRASKPSTERAHSALSPSVASAAKSATAVAATLVVIGAWLAVIAWHEHKLTSAVSALPVAVQEATFRRTYDELATTCLMQPELADHCSDDAQFILRFPQCDGACEQLARRYLPIVTK